MYAWGASTADWEGKGKYDFGSARARYDKIAASAPSKRTYTRRDAPDMKLVDPRGKTLESLSENPLIIGVDVTGSMSTWPGEIFDRLPLLYQTLAKYKPDLEVSFAAIGDAYVDNYPLQVGRFAKGDDLGTILKALCPEGGGGGQIRESYELFGQFVQDNCKTPNAKSPFLLIFGDEGFYDSVNAKQVKHYTGVDLQKNLEAKQVWENLMQRFNVYYLQKPYGSSADASVTAEVKEIWEGALGKQRVIDLPSEDRAVDVAIGLIAKQWGEYKDFKLSMDARHDDPSLKASVYKSLRHVDADPAKVSVMKTTTSKMTKSLVD